MKKETDLGFHAYIRGIILIGFALLMLAFIITGNIRYYIATNMMPFIYFATGVFLLLGVIQIIRSTSKGQEEEQLCDCGTDHSMEGSAVRKLFIYSIFIVPIILGFVLPDKVLDSSVAQNRGIQYGSGILTKPTAQGATESTSSSTSRAEAYLNDPDGYMDNLTSEPDETDEFSADEFYTEEGFNSYYDELAEELLQEDRLVVTEENYLDVMTVLDLHLDRFEGKEIEMVGFVYREPDFDDDQLVVARFGMTCCVADASVYGTMIETSEATHYENDTWVHIRGSIGKTMYNDFHIPLIHLDKITEVPEPETPYVFPSFGI
ncbi:TIGR03943 family protein [Alkalihalophilus lindianensis]|uniref:TIGR03943 family protein n=1 Tax=Alkalihalophilus lindianensis TaxID=1630542 RepID=A0ABU3X7R2_9BACI|nr:TIGR03943 family protein [Alkalihalophilus lindianensis]MDV2683313.1 TIGR03943 family protein [Alkalihalophilus lindianensis]